MSPTFMSFPLLNLVRALTNLPAFRFPLKVSLEIHPLRRCLYLIALIGYKGWSWSVGQAGDAGPSVI
jgi:hypothetical protein